MWKPILYFAEKPTFANTTSKGVLKRVDLDSPTATVLTKEGEQRVHFSWQQRTPHLTECIRHGVSFRIECTICNNNIVNMSLVIDEEALCRELAEHSVVKGEVHLVSLLMDIWRDSRIPLSPNSSVLLLDEASFTDGRWNSNLPLHAHQKQSIAWMRTQESKDSLFKYSGNIALVDSGWYVDTESQCLTQDPSWREAQYRGGVLSDGTGTGKTATILFHVLSDKSVGRGSPLSSKATLIVVPVNLVAQWKDEISKFCPYLSAIVMVQSKDLKNVSLQQLLDCEVVVTTFHFLRSCKPYSDMVETALEQHGLNSSRSRAAFAAWARIPNHREPILEAVHWKRIVVDEIHNVFDSQRELRHLKQLTATYRWGVSATPDLFTEDAQHFYWLLHREKAHHPNMLHVLLKESVRCSHSHSHRPIPDLKLVQLTVEERLHLQSQQADLTSTELVQLCSFTDVSDSVQSCDIQNLAGEFRDVRQKNVEILEAELNQYDNSIYILENAAKELDEKLQHLTEKESCDSKIRAQMEVAQQTSEQHAKDLAKFRECRRKVQAKLERAKNSMEFVSTRLESLRSRNQVCPICLDAPCSSILPCGHLYCSTCIRTHIKDNKFCPECRQSVQLNQVCGVTLGGIGSKLKEIVTLIKSIDDPVILFVQWRSMMRGMKAILRGNGIRVLNLEGTVSHRASILEEFRAGGVLLLCLEDSFAGLHLPHAKVVIFSHAIVGDCASVEMLETQAIARCVRQGQTEQVRVYSFVVSECYEEDLWKQTHG